MPIHLLVRLHQFVPVLLYLAELQLQLPALWHHPPGRPCQDRLRRQHLWQFRFRLLLLWLVRGVRPCPRLPPPWNHGPPLSMSLVHAELAWSTLYNSSTEKDDLTRLGEDVRIVQKGEQTRRCPRCRSNSPLVHSLALREERQTDHTPLHKAMPVPNRLLCRGLVVFGGGTRMTNRLKNVLRAPKEKKKKIPCPLFYYAALPLRFYVAIY